MRTELIIKLDDFFKSLSQEKAKLIRQKQIIGSLTREELNRTIIFKDIVLDDTDLGELILEDYMPIEARMAVLNKHEFYEETTMIGLLFLHDEKDEKALYSSDLNIKSESFKTVLYHLCIALYFSRNYTLCHPYINLLQQLVVDYPSNRNPPNSIIEKISNDCIRQNNKS